MAKQTDKQTEHIQAADNDGFWRRLVIIGILLLVFYFLLFIARALVFIDD